MAHVATVIDWIIDRDLSDKDIKAVAGAISGLGGTPLDHQWLAEGRAFDFFFEGEILSCEALKNAAGLSQRPVDCIVQEVETRPKKLLVADMDSTIIAQECIDEIASEMGLWDKIAPITEAAMQGKLNFRDALRERVRLLEGLPVERLEKVLNENIQTQKGARTLIKTLKKQGIKTALVSGGFSFFTHPIAQSLGFDMVHSNTLAIKDGKLTGTLTGAIVDGEGKKTFLLETARGLGLAPSETLALGDGANDIPMFRAAGFSLAIAGKPAAREAAKGNLAIPDLTGVLFALGIPEKEFA